MAHAVARRLEALATVFREYDEAAFAKEFLAKCDQRRPEVQAEWDQKWKSDADGKRLISDLFVELKLRISELKFKKKILREMKNKRTETWRIVSNLLEQGLRVE
jgi:hypothetical protein